MRAPSSLRVRIVLAALAAVTLVGLVAGGALLTAIAHDGRSAVDRFSGLYAPAEGWSCPSTG